MLLKAARVAILVSLGIATFTYGNLGKHVTVRVEGKPVGAVVRELGIKLGAHDMLVPPASTKPAPGMTIQVLRVGVRHEVVRSRMHYSTVLRRDRNLDYGSHKVIQHGRDGLRLIRYE